MDGGRLASYLANLGLISSLCDPDADVFSDELNHASMVDGCRLSRARIHVYRHRDASHLDDLLRQSGAGRKVVVTEGVFSMDGDVAPLGDLVAIKDRHGAILVVDDAHATGVLPPKGRGTSDYIGTPGVDIHVGTFSKALGSYGAFVAAPRIVVDWLVNRCRTFMFNTALPPAIAGATLAALGVLEREPERMEALWRNQAAFRREMAGHGREVRCDTPIVPVMVGGDAVTMAVSRAVQARGGWSRASGRRPCPKAPGACA